MGAEQQRASARASAPEDEGYKPHRNTVWLCEERGAGLLGSWMDQCRMYLLDKYGQVFGTMVQTLPVARLNPSHEIVVLYYESKTRREGKKVVSERTVLQSPPIACKDFYAEGVNPDDISMDAAMGMVSVTNEKYPDGRTKKGLCQQITDLCMAKGDYGKPVPTVRAIYRADTRELRVARD